MYRLLAFALSLLLLCPVFTLTGAANSAPVVTLSAGDTTRPLEAGESLPLPTAPTGKVFAGWTAPGVFLPAGVPFTPSESVTLTALFVGLSTQGTLRLGVGKGLRFLTRMDRADYTALCACTTVAYGTVIAPLSYAQAANNSLAPAALTAAGKTKQLDLAATAFYEESQDVLTFAGSVVALKGENYSRDYVASGYLKVRYTNGTDGLIMAPVSAPVCPYTLANAAHAAGNAPAEDQTYLSHLLAGCITLDYWMSGKDLTLTPAHPQHTLPYAASYDMESECVLLTVKSGSSFRFDQHFCNLTLDGYLASPTWNAINVKVLANGTVLSVSYPEYTPPR